MNGMASEQVLVIEDDHALRELVVEELAEQGYEVSSAGDVASALGELEKSRPDLVLCDLRLPDGSGFDVLEAAKSHPAIPAIILITAFGSVPQAVEALKAGADDFLTKPMDLEHLTVRIERALAHRRASVMFQRFRRNLNRSGNSAHFHEMVGASDVMQGLFEEIRRVAPINDPVLITGESGSGKELVAKAIHEESDRRRGPFVAINCATVPESLLEAEFFGHTANAFTGAGTARRGLFWEASGGTLFLDEIGELPTSLQPKLLRALQENRVRPLGSSEEVPVDVRIVAATNRDIEEELQAGRWREDFYYRLETFSLHVPPLRERGDDVLEIAAHVLALLAEERSIPHLTLAEDALAQLRNYHFPGNVRELANALSRATTFAENGRIEARHLPARMQGDIAAREPLIGDPLGIGGDPLPTLAELESRYIRWVVERLGGNKKRAAELLEVGRRTIYRKLGES